MEFKILVINPGSTSTKIAVYQDETPLFVENISHTTEQLAGFDRVSEQLDFRKEIVTAFLREKGVGEEELSAVIGRGGLLPGLKSGGYLVNETMATALAGEDIPAHASNLGGLLAAAIAAPLGLPPYIYDAVTSGELPPVARITGIPKVMRQSFCHALNSRAMAIQYAKQRGERYEALCCIVAHLGGGVSVSLHMDGKIVDSMSDDDGPFSPERSGGVPLLNVIDMCYSGEHTKEEMKKIVRGKGGMYAHLGTSDCREIEERIAAGDEEASLVFQAQAYQIAKGIGVMAMVSKGRADVIILTGGVANSKLLTDMISEYVDFVAPVCVMPGENEMESLALGALRILRGEEEARSYEE